MPPSSECQNVAVIGAGVAGVACARGLSSAGHRVTIFEGAPQAGGRMAGRRVAWTDAAGRTLAADFDLGAASFAARGPRWQAIVERARSEGLVQRWHPRVHADTALPAGGERLVALPDAPALLRHWLGAVPLRTRHQLRQMRRGPRGWMLAFEQAAAAGPFDVVVLAVPPRQAAALLSTAHKPWAEALAALRMAPCWTLMAVTDEVDWPWDAAEPSRGPLVWVARNDRVPGRSAPVGCASWVAHAGAGWSAAHGDETAAAVSEALRGALQALLPPQRGAARRWHHAAAHLWREALSGAVPQDPWWDAGLGLAVCGDALGGAGVEAAWTSGDELADRMAAELEAPHAEAGAA